MAGTGELIGILAALVILVLVFGSVVAAGLPVVFASSTVLVSLLGLRLSGLPTFSVFGFATAISVVSAAAAAAAAPHASPLPPTRHLLGVSVGVSPHC